MNFPKKMKFLIIMFVSSVVFTSNNLAFGEEKELSAKELCEQAVKGWKSGEINAEDFLQLLRISSERGWWKSAYILGDIYLNFKDKYRSYFWFVVAIELVASPFTPSPFPTHEEVFILYKQKVLDKVPARKERKYALTIDTIEAIERLQNSMNNEVNFQLEDLIEKRKKVERFLSDEEVQEISSFVYRWLSDFGFWI